MVGTLTESRTYRISNYESETKTTESATTNVRVRNYESRTKRVRNYESRTTSHELPESRTTIHELPESRTTSQELPESWTTRVRNYHWQTTLLYPSYLKNLFLIQFLLSGPATQLPSLDVNLINLNPPPFRLATHMSSLDVYFLFKSTPLSPCYTHVKSRCVLPF